SRPEKLNALDPAMFAGLVDTGRGLAADPSLRAVVLSGEGRGFCAGLDFASFMRLGDDGGRLLARREDGSAVNHAQRAAWVWSELPVPVIAAVHGVAYRGGLPIAIAADIPPLAPAPRLSVMETPLRPVPGVTRAHTLRPLLHPP